MIIGNKENQTELMAFLPSMKSNKEEWQILTVKLPKEGQAHLQDILDKLMLMYKDKDGVLFPVNNRKAVVVVRLGNLHNYTELKSDIESSLPQHGARVVARKMNGNGMRQIQLDLSKTIAGKPSNELELYQKRENRYDNTFLVVDDDEFAREAVKGLLAHFGEVHEAADGEEALKIYKDCNPDVVFLDIHMPGKEGLELVNEILDIDTDAFIVMVSADSAKEKVMDAISCGAVGFIVKPLKKDKLFNYLDQCITYRNPLK